MTLFDRFEIMFKTQTREGLTSWLSWASSWSMSDDCLSKNLQNLALVYPWTRGESMIKDVFILQENSREKNATHLHLWIFEKVLDNNVLNFSLTRTKCHPSSTIFPYYNWRTLRTKSEFKLNKDQISPNPSLNDRISHISSIHLTDTLFPLWMEWISWISLTYLGSLIRSNEGRREKNSQENDWKGWKRKKIGQSTSKTQKWSA